ncbi:hypothetical protein Ddc_01100 [Ditylenchus destructor]|nr:hypothetical protein Ddc_01100 [Ditylenchus destructor]
MRQNSRNKVYESIDSLGEQSTQNSEKFANTVISEFDRALLFLLHKILLKLAIENLSSCLELCSKILFPKLSKVHDTSFAQSLMLLIMCSVSDNPMVYNRIYLVLPTDNYAHGLESLSMEILANDLMNCFIVTAQSNGFNWSKAALLQIFSQVVFNNDKPKEDPRRISIFNSK